MRSMVSYTQAAMERRAVNWLSIVLSYRRDTTGVPSINGNHDCKMTMLATAPGTLLDSSLWRIYEEVVFSHGSTRGIDLAVFPPSANSAFNKRSKAF